jgi:hypothetical protein
MTQTYNSNGIVNKFAVAYFTQKSNHILLYPETQTPSESMATTYREALEKRYGDDSQLMFAVVRLSTFFGMVD